MDSYLPTAPVFQLGGVLVGHVSGRMETRGWDTDNQQLLSNNNTELEHTDIQVTPPQQFFASGTTLPIGLSRTAPQQIAETAGVSSPPATAAPAVAQSEPDSPPEPEQVDVAGNTEPEVTPEAPAGEIENVGYEEPAAAEAQPEAK
jgi:hypothetical protein